LILNIFFKVRGWHVFCCLYTRHYYNDKNVHVYRTSLLVIGIGTGYGLEMIRSNLLSLKSGTDLLGKSGSLQKGNIEKRRSQFGLMEGPMAFFSVLKGNMSSIKGQNEKTFGEGIVSLEKGLHSKEGFTDGGAGIHRSDREVIAHFLKDCGFNEKEIEKIVYAVRDNSLNVKIKEPAVIGGKGVIGAGSPRLGLLDESASGKLSSTEISNKGVASELIDHKTEIFHKGIRPSDNLINGSFSGEKPQYNISQASNLPLNEGDIKPYILIKQIVESAGKKLSNGAGRVKIALHPPHLGTLHMDVVLNNDKVQVILKVENDKVRHILQLNVEQLKNSLNSNGLIVDNVNVFLQEKSDNNNYGFGQNEYLFKEGRNRGENEGNQGDERDFLTHNSSKSEEKELGLQTDGHISLFA
jgi:hypothetical protein